MTSAEWEQIADHAKLTWGRTPDADRRLAFWHNRWLSVPYERMRLALKMLERQCDAWPGPAKMHAVLDGLEGSAKGRVRQPLHRDVPLTAAEWRELSEHLGAAADMSREAKRKSSGNLIMLALFYAENAERVERGDVPLWPPPPWAGGAGSVLAGAAHGQQPAVRRPPNPFFDDGREP